MQEEFISFETAKLAKEKGFTIRTIGSHRYADFRADGSTGSISATHLNLDSPAQVPQSLLKKWLRDTHGIIVVVNPIFKDDTYTEFEYWYFIHGIEDESDEEVFYGTWEEATEKGLQEGITLIKNR